MKIKNINDFTLAECQDYLDANPDGELAQEISARMEYLQDTVDNEKKQELTNYEKEYRRLYITGQFAPAFFKSLHILCEYGEIKWVRKNAEEVLKHISPHKYGAIASPKASVEINNDWLIDLFFNNGYKLAIISPDRDHHYERIRVKRIFFSDYAFNAFTDDEDGTCWVFWKYKDNYSLPNKEIIMMIGRALIEEAIRCSD